MAQIKRGILGGFSGKVGNVVGSSWKGIETMRALPISVLNPRTTAQVYNRNRFGYVSKFASSILSSLIKPLNDRFAQRMSGYNLFCSRNRDLFDEVGCLSDTNLVLCSGKLGTFEMTSCEILTPGQLKVTWPDSASGAYQSNTDKVYLLVIDGNGNLLAVSAGEVELTQGTVTMSIPTTLKNPNILVYGALMREDSSMVSNTSKVVTEVE